MGEYRKLQPKKFEPRSIRETAEGRYWRAYKSPALLDQISQVTSVAFADVYPYALAVTSSARVTVYNSQNRMALRTFARFKDVAYGGVLRGDAKALAVGGQAGMVQLFDMSSRSILRKFTQHARAVRAVRFSTQTHAIMGSASDDTTVRIWDIAAGVCSRRHDGHTDYARSIASHPISIDRWATGSYDHTVKLWDDRDGSMKHSLSLNHGAPVEDISWLPGGNLLVSVGGQDVCVWDVLSGGKLLRKLRCHQKTIMCCHVAPDGGPPIAGGPDGSSLARRYATARSAPRLLTGSLDGHVKVHELDDFTVTHAAKYPCPVLSVALSPDANVIAVGCANKLLSIRRRKVPREAAYGLCGVGGRVCVGGGKKRGPRRLDAGSWQYFVRGTNEKAAEGQMVIARRKQIRLKPYDKALRRFRVGEALDAALATGRPEVIAAVVEEIGARGGTRAALSNRDEARLGPVLRFIARQIANPRHTRQLVGVAGKVLDVYGGEVGVSPAVDGALRLIRERVAGTLKLQDALANLSGIAAPLLAAGHHAAYG